MAFTTCPCRERVIEYGEPVVHRQVEAAAVENKLLAVVVADVAAARAVSHGEAGGNSLGRRDGDLRRAGDRHLTLNVLQVAAGIGKVKTQGGAIRRSSRERSAVGDQRGPRNIQVNHDRRSAGRDICRRQRLPGFAVDHHTLVCGAEIRAQPFVTERR